MKNVVGISFIKGGKIYYFENNLNDLKIQDNVIVETERGKQIGQVVLDNIDTDNIKNELKKVLRKATKEDLLNNLKNSEEAKKAIEKCRELVKKYNLNMQIIDASFTFDKSQLLFKFLSDNRVDFRNLAKDLANIYKTRIELRQVGARDKAKEIGGCGLCGRKLCCSAFLEDLESVSINMAKNQNISLNPSKINGLCGRLLCCLKYEDETYRECRKDLPQIGKRVKTEQGEGKVVSLDIINKKYTVNIPDVGFVDISICNHGNN